MQFTYNSNPFNWNIAWIFDRSAMYDDGCFSISDCIYMYAWLTVYVYYLNSCTCLEPWQFILHMHTYNWMREALVSKTRGVSRGESERKELCAVDKLVGVYRNWFGRNWLRLLLCVRWRVWRKFCLHVIKCGARRFRLDERQGARIDGIVAGVGMSDSRVLVT